MASELRLGQKARIIKTCKLESERLVEFIIDIHHNKKGVYGPKEAQPVNKKPIEEFKILYKLFMKGGYQPAKRLLQFGESNLQQLCEEKFVDTLDNGFYITESGVMHIKDFIKNNWYGSPELGAFLVKNVPASERKYIKINYINPQRWRRREHKRIKGTKKNLELIIEHRHNKLKDFYNATDKDKTFFAKAFPCDYSGKHKYVTVKMSTVRSYEVCTRCGHTKKRASVRPDLYQEAAQHNLDRMA